MTIRLSPLDSSARLVPRVADQTTVLCPICGQPNPVKAKQCAACGITFTTGAGTEKVDAILEDLLELAKAPPDAASGTSPEAESPGLFRLANSEVAQGDRLVKEGRYGDALPHYERAIRMVRRPSYAWTSRGVAMKYLGRLDEALRCHENAIRLDATNEVAWCN